MPSDNILFITTDQQRFDTIQALGNGSIYTPHLNYLVSEGVAFTRCYADCPVCVPARTTMMTGLAGYESGLLENGGHQALMETITGARATLPAILTDNGYQTRAVGKMHFEPARACYGFESMELPLDYMRWWDAHRGEGRPKAHGLPENAAGPCISTVEVKDSITTWTVDRSINFIETRDPLRPFFLWTSFTKPHPPWDPCRDFWLLYNTGDMPPPVYGDWSADAAAMPKGFAEGGYYLNDMHLYSPRQLQAAKRAYYATITQVDYALGNLFGCLREQGLDDSTWIVFTSDHGEMLGDHHLSAKSLFFEGAAHVPLVIVPPKGRDVARGQRVDALVQLADIYPTLLDIAGLHLPDAEGRAGASLLQPPPDRVFYGNHAGRHFCVICDKIKLVYTAVGGHALLFNLEDDPMEQADLAGDDTWRPVFEDMWQMLVEHTAKTAPEALDNGAFIVYPEPAGPADVTNHWYGFHYKDYSVDVFH